VYEIDQPEVIEFKVSTLSQLGAVPAAEHRTVGIDLREDWPAALQSAGFDTAQPTAWLAEGVLIGFLPPEAEVRLLDNVITLSATGSRFSADYGSLNQESPESQEQARITADGWRRQGLDLDIAGLAYPGEHTDVAAHMEAHGWNAARSTLAELFTAAGLPELTQAEQQGQAALINFVRALRT
jgi:methyltransferase (TIGR00027 family)